MQMTVKCVLELGDTVKDKPIRFGFWCSANLGFLGTVPPVPTGYAYVCYGILIAHWAPMNELW